MFLDTIDTLSKDRLYNLLVGNLQIWRKYFQASSK